MSISPDPVTLGPGELRTIYFTVSVPSISGVLQNELTIIATAQTDCSGTATNPAAVHTFVINQDPGLTLVQNESGQDIPGETVTYEHLLTNTGNYYDNTIWLTWRTNPAWTVEVNGGTEQPLEVSLSQGGVMPVTVDVTIPDDATCGMSNTTIITATSWAGFYAANGWEIVRVSVVDSTRVQDVYGVEFAPDRTGNISSNPSQEVAITYTHRITNTGNCRQIFGFLHHSSQGFTVTTPSPVTLDPYGGATDVTVYVTMPPTTTTGLIVDTTVITAYHEGHDIWPKEAVVDTTIVNQTAGLSLAPDNTVVITQPSSSDVQVYYTHTLTNNSNYTDSFNLTWLNENGWQAAVEGQTAQPARVTVGSGLTTAVQVEVTLPWSVYTITGRTVITAASQFSPTVTASAVNTTTVRRPHVTLWPDYEQNVAPGDIITHTHRLTNTGGVSDSYVITYHSSLGWAVVTPTVVYTLMPGSGVPIWAIISVPTSTDILSGTEDMLVITATSQITAVVYDTAVDTTTVPYVPGATLAPDPGNGQAQSGSSVVYTHTLTNTGNYTESFHLQTWSEFANSSVSPEWVYDLGPGEAYTPVIVTVLLPTHAAAGETEETQILISFAGERVVARDYTLVLATAGTRYVALEGTNLNNNCREPGDYGPCATVQQAVDQALAGDEARVAQGVYTDVHASGEYTQAVYLDKNVTLLGGYIASDWNAAPDPSANQTILDAGGQGRVVYVAAGVTPTIEGFHLRLGYIEGDGAGIYIAPGAEPVVRWNSIYSNTAAGAESKGGGVYYNASGDLALERNTIHNNTAYRGGGLYIFGFGSEQRVWNNVLYHNTGDYGGGLYLSSDDATVWNNTFYSNTADFGGGLCINGGSPSISNTIFAHNANYGIYKVGGSGGAPALDYNLVWENSPANFYGVNPGGNTITNTPGFVDAANADFHLRSNAANTIDQGDPDATLPDDDLDGNPRPLPTGGNHDIGAYENALTIGKKASAFAPSGGTITYTIAITNSGSAPCDILVTDTLHYYLDHVATSSTPAGSSGYSDHTVSWQGAVYSNTTAYITVTATITDWLIAGTAITNVALVNHVPTPMVMTIITGTHGARYVAGTGHDTMNNCMRPDMPCLTIQQAVDHALAGDEVRVASGVYTGTGQAAYLGKDLMLTGGYTPTLPTWTYNPSAYTTTLDAQTNVGVVVTNSATVMLGGLHIINGADGVDVNAATVVISQCHIYSNTDGVDVDGGSYTLINNVVAHNSGAGVRAASSTGSLLHNTFARNTAAGAVVNNTARFTNTIFYSHSVGVNVTGGTAYLSNTLWYSNTSNTGAVISSTSLFDLDPRFENPDGLDYHIQPGSSVIDKGLDNWLSEDIDGDNRPLLQHPDLGADEFALVIVKRSPSTADPGQIITYSIMLQGGESGLVFTDTLHSYLAYTGTIVCTVGDCGYLSAQRAITWTGDLSMQPAYITYTTQITSWLAAGERILNDADVLIAGDVHQTNETVTTINAVNGPRYVDAATGDNTDGGTGNNCLTQWKPCATVQYAVNQALASDTVKVAAGDYAGSGSEVVSVGKSITLTGGYTTTNGWLASDPEAHPTYLNGEGGRRAVVVSGAVNVTIDGFHLLNGSASSGAGLYVNGATVTLLNSRVHDNTATNGGGGGIYATNASVTLNDNRIYTNTASSDGGGLYALNSPVLMERNLILDNQADLGGGVAVTNTARITMTNNIVGSNRASSGGDGLLFDGSGSGLLRHNTIADNDGDGVRVGDFTLNLTNTILSGHTVGIVTSDGSASVTASYTLLDGNTTNYNNSGGGSITHNNDVTGSPAYRDQAGMDYHITGSSAAAGAGIEAGVATDIDGENRTSPPDIGADQYNLRVDRWASSVELAPCQTVIHTLTLTNVADSLISGVLLTDALPSEVTYNSGSLTYTAGNGGYLASSQAITWSGDLTAQSSVYITYSVDVKPYLADGTLITFTAFISDPVSAFPGNPLLATVRTITATASKQGVGAVSPVGEATIGELVTYTVVYTVPGGHKTIDPVVVDELPRIIESGGGVSTTSALAYVPGSLSISGATTQTEEISADGGTITWTLDSITATCGAPSVATLIFNARLLDLSDNDGGDALTNTLTISYDDGVSNRVIGDEQVLTLVEPGLTLTHTAAMTQNLGMGDLVLITVTVANPGSSMLYDVVLTDTLGSGWVRSDTGGSVFTHTLGSIGAGSSETIIFTARVNDDVVPLVSLTATASAVGSSLPGVEPDERVYNASEPFTATTGSLDLEISKDAPPVRSPNQSITYTITYTNTGVVRAVDVQITDTLPFSLTDVLSVTSAGATVERVGQAITWTLTAPVSRSVSGHIWITAIVAGSTPEWTVLTNSVAITTTSVESDTVNNSDLVTTIVRMPSLSITKTLDPAEPLTARPLTYTLTISNSGVGDATGLLISDRLPLSTTYHSCRGGDCGFDGVSDTITWTLPLLPGGEQAFVSFTVLVDSDAYSGTVIINPTFAVTCAQGVGDTGGPLTSTVPLRQELALAPSSAQKSIMPGARVVYTHTLINWGTIIAPTVTLTVSNPPTDWAYTLQPTEVISLGVGADAGEIVTLTVTAPSGTGQATAVITATWQGLPAVRATAVDTTTIGCTPVAGVSISYTPIAPVIGQTITFTGTVTAGTTPLEWDWNFGDSNTDTGQFVTHVYDADDSYTAQLTVTNCGGGFSDSDTQIVVVSPYNIYLPLVLRNYH